jgi:hypothetical protein
MLLFKQMPSLWISISAVLFISNAGAASMNDTTLFGTMDDPRIQQCGIRISGGDWVELAPFIQTAADFNGSFDIGITKTSKSGTSQTRQSNRIKGGASNLSRIRLDRPERLEIRMSVADESGKVVCRLSETLDMPDGSMRL